MSGGCFYFGDQAWGGWGRASLAEIVELQALFSGTEFQCFSFSDGYKYNHTQLDCATPCRSWKLVKGDLKVSSFCCQGRTFCNRYRGKTMAKGVYWCARSLAVLYLTHFLLGHCCSISFYMCPHCTWNICTTFKYSFLLFTHNWLLPSWHQDFKFHPCLLSSSCSNLKTIINFSCLAFAHFPYLHIPLANYVLLISTI